MILRINLKYLIFLLLSGQISSVACAGDLESQGPLSLNQTLVLAIKSHPLISSAKSQYRAAKSELSASRWSRFPTVAAGSQETADNVKQDTSTVSLPLWAGGKINADIDLAKSRRDSALSGVSEAYQAVMLESIGAFF